MKDITSLVIEAQDARARMQEAKKRIKAEARRKYEAAMKLEIEEAITDAEIEFARTLARVHASGVSQSVLRREVLRTNVWGEWTKWRDLAQIEPERVTVRNAKAERERQLNPYQWSDDYLTLTVVRNTRGEEIEPVTYTLDVWQIAQGNYWPDEVDSKDNQRAAMQDRQFIPALMEEIKAQHENGNIPVDSAAEEG